jgi:TatA/E family protein of Tat protein translocase
MINPPCMAFIFDTGLDEWALLGAIIFILFGPKKLPEMARSIGRVLEKLRHAADDFKSQVSQLDEEANSAVSTDALPPAKWTAGADLPEHPSETDGTEPVPPKEKFVEGRPPCRPG